MKYKMVRRNTLIVVLISAIFICISIKHMDGISYMVTFHIGGRLEFLFKTEADGEDIEKYFTPYPSNLIPSDGSWQKINCLTHKCFAYSAFYDSRNNTSSVRVIGTTILDNPEPVLCRMWYKKGNSFQFLSKTVEADTIIIKEHHYYEYSACFFICPLPPDLPVPQQVSLSTDTFSPLENLLTVINNPKEYANKEFAICVQPLYDKPDMISSLLEFIVLNTILGVKHFTFYNHDIGAKENCLLDYYKNKGTVTILPWRIDLVSKKDVHVENMLAALNDCLYRSMYRFSHVLFIDLDEFIIPNDNIYTISELTASLELRKKPHPIGAYYFQNAFFFLQWNDVVKPMYFDKYPNVNLLTQKKIRREVYFYNYGIRSKYIGKPEYIVEANIHVVGRFIPGYKPHLVHHDEAYLHHYRYCFYRGDDCLKINSTIDATALKYNDKLYNVMNSILHEVYKVCKV